MDVEHREFASFSRRAGATLIDTFVYVLASAVINVLLFGLPDVSVLFVEDDVYASSGSSWMEQVISAVITIGMWMKFKATPGKMLLDCVVVDERTGKPVGFTQGVIRYLGYFLSVIPLGLGFFWVIWDKKRQGFHDKLAKTVVLYHVNHFGEDESTKPLQQLIREVR
ncbi:MAG: RDD family protein [Gammaproteobacteria bacterium]|nr:RDD family protein [Gammaproteobacteria bacterium]